MDIAILIRIKKYTFFLLFQIVFKRCLQKRIYKKNRVQTEFFLVYLQNMFCIVKHTK